MARQQNTFLASSHYSELHLSVSLPVPYSSRQASESHFQPELLFLFTSFCFLYMYTYHWYNKTSQAYFTSSFLFLMSESPRYQNFMTPWFWSHFSMLPCLTPFSMTLFFNMLPHLLHSYIWRKHHTETSVMKYITHVTPTNVLCYYISKQSCT